MTDDHFSLDTRHVLLGYAALCAVFGITTVGWGHPWVTANTAHTGWSDATTIRLVGAMLVAGACIAMGLEQVEEAATRRRGLLWFSVAHGVVLATMTLPFGPGVGQPPRLVTGLLLAATMILLYAWGAGDGQIERRGWTPITLFGEDDHLRTQHLRSSYERRIWRAARQEERHRIARDLHDAVQQHLFVAQTAAATAQTRFDSDPPGAHAALEDIRTAAREAMGDIEAMLHGLDAPLDNGGLIEALRQHCDALSARTGVHVEVSVGDLPPEDILVPGAHDAVFRVAQEALANVGRHAQAHHVRVALGGSRRSLELRIEDDGIGINASDVASGRGVANMRTRAQEYGGTLSVSSRSSGGTLVTVRLPSAIPLSHWPDHPRSRALTSGLWVLAMATLVWQPRTAFSIGIALFSAFVCISDIASYRRTATPARSTP